MMSKPQFLICTDLDRTLLPNGNQPESDGAIEYFKSLVSRPEVKLAYVSGRDKKLIREAIHEFDIPVPDYAISDVGSNIYAIEDGHWELWNNWHDEISPDWGTHTQYSLAELLDTFNEISLQEEYKQGKYKLSYYADPKIDTVNLFRDINTCFHNRGIRASIIWSVDETSDTALLDILPANANKLHAIHFLMQSLSISVEQVVFCGDSGNDIDVLCSDLPAVLVANATRKVQQESEALCKLNKTTEKLYIAKGDFMGMNGNYAAGIIEGVIHYHPGIKDWLKLSR